MPRLGELSIVRVESHTASSLEVLHFGRDIHRQKRAIELALVLPFSQFAQWELGRIDVHQESTARFDVIILGDIFRDLRHLADHLEGRARSEVEERHFDDGVFIAAFDFDFDAVLCPGHKGSAALPELVAGHEGGFVLGNHLDAFAAHRRVIICLYRTG